MGDSQYKYTMCESEVRSIMRNQRHCRVSAIVGAELFESQGVEIIAEVGMIEGVELTRRQMIR